jgi:hypothetical protein
MSFHINSDKEKIRGVNPKLIGDNEATIRIGTGADEKEVLRTELDSTTQLPRVGINRTGQRVNNIVLQTAGTGYTVNPTVTIGPPNTPGGVQALASAFIFNGKVTTVAVNNPGSGYTQAPLVTISEGGGQGATAIAELDTVDYELDINGAIRTSTSIISDTARILNLDIDNFVTPNAEFRGPNLKTYMNNTGTLWSSNVILQQNQYRYFGANVYQALNTGQTGSEAPEHTDGIVKNGEVDFKHIGFRVNDPNAYKYNETGAAGEFPRSITPLLGDRSDKIATTEYVLNLATNDVGGRIYVSAQIGSDLNDGRSAVNPVRTIKKAAQEAWKTPGVKETIIVSGGDYVEDNPISLPPDCSVVGDNLRLVIIRPANPGKHIMKFGDKNYVIGVTYRDQIDSNGDAVATWDFAMVFDDKQRVMVDLEANGDFGTTFPVGHQIFGPQQFRVTFQNNTGLATLVSNLTVKGVNTGSRAKVIDVAFATTTGASAYVNGTIDVLLQSGSFVEGEQFSYITSAGAGAAYNLTATEQRGDNTLRLTTDPTGTIPGGTVVQIVATPSSGTPFTGFYEVATIDTTQSASNIWDVTFVPILNAPSWSGNGIAGTYTINQATPQTETIDTTKIKSIRAEGEVVSVDEDYTTTLPISRIDFSLQGDPSIATGGFQSAQFGNAEDLGGIVFYTNALVGRTNTHDFKEGQEILLENLPTSNPDLSFLNGKQRIYKVIEDADGRCRRFVIPKKVPSITDANLDPGQFATVKSFSKVVTLSLLNSPNTFPLSTPVERRFQDACTFLRNNREFIADEVVGRINRQFAKDYYQVSEITGGGDTFKVFLGQTPVTHTYVSGGTVKFENTTVNITGFVYDNANTGYATITVDTALTTLVDDDTVKLADILLSCEAGQKTYPSYSSPTSGNNTGSDGDEQCRQDVIHFVNALIRDLEFGSNFNIIEAAKKYIVGGDIAYIKDEIVQNFRAIEYARELCIYAMRNWRTGNGTPTDPIYTPVYSTVPRYFDDTVITSTALLNADGTPNNTGFACNDVRSAIDTLAFLWVDVITKNQNGTYLDAAYLIERNKHLIADQALRDTLGQFPLFALDNTNERKCKRDIAITLSNLAKDLCFGGNENIVAAAESYFTSTALTGIPEAQRAETVYAYQRAKTYAIAAMRNWSDGTYVDFTPTNAVYTASTGALDVIFPDPIVAPVVGDRIAFKEEAIAFQCTYNSNTETHSSPLRTDANYGKSHVITAVSSSGGVTTVSCNVGDAGLASGSAHTFVSAVANGSILIYNPTQLTSPIPKFEDWNILLDASAGNALAQHTPTAATYNPANGDFTMTVVGHSVTTSNSIKLAPESFTFTCAMDGNATEHRLPESGQAAYANSLPVTSTTADTFTINVGASGPDQQWTPSDATYDPATGSLVLTIGSGHGLSTGEGVVIDDGGLSFTCTMDGNQTTKTYPRNGIDPYSGRSIPIDSVTDTTITLNVGVSGPNVQFTALSGTTYDATTGDLVLNIGQHGLGVGRGIVIATDSLSFTCDQDSNGSIHTYPRASDPAAGQSLAITAVGSTQHTVTNAVYTASNGRLVLTSAGHGFANGDYIKIADGSLTFTCDLDGNTAQKAYPRANFDYPSGRWLQISNVTTDTFEVSVGNSSYTGAHTFVSATANGIDRQTGTITVNVGASPAGQQYTHNFVSSTVGAISHSPQSAHTFVTAATNCLKHLPQSAHTFVRAAQNAAVVYASGGNANCSGVASSINTSMELFEDILDGTIPAGSTNRTSNPLYDTAQILSYPENFVTDSNNNRLAIRGIFDDYPIIEASPYTQNASVISFLGGGGAEVDGAKVKQPNCPFPGLELDGTASFPNQGKSMVASAFTIVSFGGTGYKVINDGYTQLVSVFVIFCADGVLAESGGYCSITNSATNFGQFALRGVGFRKDPYEFDIATISNVSSTPTGRTILTVSGLGREPLEHYVVKIDGYENTNPDIEYFIDVVAGVTVGPPFSAQLTIDDGTGGAMDLTDKSTGQAVATSVLSGQTINLHRPSIVNSSSHTWEFAGSGTNYLALPENGGTKIEAYEQVSEQYGRVYVSGTDELGDFKVGTFARIENRTGAITFTGTVTISEVEFLKLKGGDVVVTGFDASNTLGGANSSDSKLPTQKAVRDYITNNLGPYINKPYSTNAVPRALVELTDSGKISIDQIPALRPFSVFTVANQAERTSLEGALAGDIAIQQDTSQSFILNNDNDSLFLGFQPDASLAFTVGDIFTGSLTGGRIQATEYRKGVVYQINVTNGGSGYTTAPTITFSGGNPEAGAVSAAATCTIANGQVVTVTIIDFNGFKGGKGYTTAPTVTFAAPVGAGTQAVGNALIESRLYGDIVNNIKIEDTDTFDDSTSPTANTVNINRVVNTSSFTNSNWVSLSSNQIAASDITSGVIETDRLASGGAANSFTFLRGDQNFALAMQSIKGAEGRYFAKLASQCTTGSSQMVFTTNSDVLIGHEVKNTVSGVQANTNITGVITAAGLTTISLNNPVNATIPLGTIIEFERGASPLTFESTFTQGGFVDDVIIANAGSGYTNGQYFDVSLVGGSGTGLKVNFVVAGNAVTEITVTDGGTGYSGDFTITTAPGALGAGSNLVLEAKVSTVNRQYANVAIDVQRATDLTISADLYGTIGVSRFKKSQFNIGQAGNGSIELKTGADSGLDADLLDGVQGSFYLNASNMSAGTLSSDRLSGTYNISISGTAGNTIRVLTGTNNPSSSPAPNNFSSGIVANTIFNSANGLNDGGTRNMTVTFRNGGSGFDAGFGGVRQLAFTDNDNMYIRGSGTGVSSFGTWAKVWSSLNDGLDSGLDADRLDNRQGDWYQNALNINYGTLSDNRLPRFISATNFRDNVTVKGFLGDPKFRIYFSGVILDTSSTGVFAPGNPINLYNANAQAVGSFTIDSVTVNDDTSDNFNDFTILIGRLTSGNFIGALTAGSASNRQPFDDFTLEDGNTVDVGKIVNNAGSGELKLGRVDGQSSSPAIYFRSSQLVPGAPDNHFTAKLEAAGGTATAGSGTLALTVLNADAFTINGQRAWNEGNIQFSSSNIANYAVQRDGSGNFSAGTITATLTGAASLNVLKTGDTMTGSLVLTGAGSNLTVSGTATINNVTTLTNDLNVDSNTLFVDASENKIGIGETVFTNRAGQSYVKLRMRPSNFNGYGNVHGIDFAQFNGNWVDGSGGADSQFGMAFTYNDAVRGGLLYDHRGSERLALWSGYGRISFMVDPGRSGNEVPLTVGTEAMTVDYTGTVGIATSTPSSSYKLDVNGQSRFRNYVTLDTANDNSGAGLYFLGSSSQRNFRIGNQIGHSNAFEITASTSGGGTSWNGTPALLVKGDNRVSINTNATSGTDPTNNTNRNYQLNVQGDINLNGQFFQNNQEFVTSRWTEASNGNDIYRLSRVGVKKSNPTYDLHVAGSVNVEGQTFVNQANTSVLYANGVRQWIDSYGIFKANSQVVAENITVPNGTNCGSFGPITINNNIVITVADGGSWNIV